MSRVLVVDDDANVRDMICTVLSDDRYEKDTAVNGVDALELMAKNDYDVVILDLRMPGEVDGTAVLSRYQEIAPRTKIIVLTGYPSYDTVIHALRESAAEYLEKPIQPQRLIESVEAATTRFEAGGFTIYLNSGTVRYGDLELPLTHTEFKILAHLVRFPYTKFSYADLAKAVHGKEVSQQEAMNSLRSHMSRLRARLRKVTGREIISSGYNRSFSLLVD